MTDKLGPGIIHEQAPGDAQRWAALDAEKRRLRKRRDDARWYIVAGVAMMFAGSFSAYFALGGVVMAVYGGAATFYWGRRLGKLENPWEDPEIDAWEEEHFGP